MPCQQGLHTKGCTFSRYRFSFQNDQQVRQLLIFAAAVSVRQHDDIYFDTAFVVFPFVGVPKLIPFLILLQRVIQNVQTACQVLL